MHGGGVYDIHAAELTTIVESDTAMGFRAYGERVQMRDGSFILSDGAGTAVVHLCESIKYMVGDKTVGFRAHL